MHSWTPHSHTPVSGPPSGPPSLAASRRSHLRVLLDACCPRDPEFDAFCSDHFPATFRRFSAAMERVQRVTLLLEYEGPAALEQALASAFPAQYASSPIPSLPPAPPSLLPATELPPRRPGVDPLRLWSWLGWLLFAASAGLLLLTLAGWLVHRALDRPQVTASTSVAPAVGAETPSVPAGMSCLSGATIRQRTETGEITVAVAPFCMDLNLVTSRQYRDCFSEGRCNRTELTNYHQKEDQAGKSDLDGLCTERLPGHDLHPMNCISWYDASYYCAAQRGRLPTAAEWEVAAGAEQNQPYPWGFDAPSPAVINACDARCVEWAAKRGKIWTLMRGSSILLHESDGTASDRLFDGDDGYAATSPVGSKAASLPYGFYDLSGNLRQWTIDRPTDCSEPNCEVLHILKGGSWGDVRAEHVGLLARAKAPPALQSEMHGFRCVIPRPQPNTGWRHKMPIYRPTQPARKFAAR